MGADVAPKPAINFDDNVAAGLRTMGVCEAEIERHQGNHAVQETAPDFEVYADNWVSVLFFLSLRTQWSFATDGMGFVKRLGLIYPAVESAMRMRGTKRAKQLALLEDVQVMEFAALQVVEERAQAHAAANDS